MYYWWKWYKSWNKARHYLHSRNYLPQPQSTCLSIHLFKSLPCPSHLHIYLSIYFLIYLKTLSVCLSMYLSDYLSSPFPPSISFSFLSFRSAYPTGILDSHCPQLLTMFPLKLQSSDHQGFTLASTLQQSCLHHPRGHATSAAAAERTIQTIGQVNIGHSLITLENLKWWPTGMILLWKQCDILWSSRQQYLHTRQPYCTCLEAVCHARQITGCV